MKKPNTLYPGRPNYKGPKKGWFGLIHHDKLFEWSDDIQERVTYIKESKPKNEVSHWLHCLVYLSKLPEELVKARVISYDGVLALITKLVPDHTWDGKTIKFD